MHQAPIIKESLTQYLPKNPIIVEAGAHIGRDTLKLAKIWPKGEIHAFEPVPDLYLKLVMRTQDYPNVRCYNSALSDHRGTETFYVSSGASSAVSSLYAPHDYVKDRPNVFFEKTEVETITLDQWAQECGISHVDFMWLDMQGAELKVMKAAPKILATVQVMVVEASLTERFKAMPLYDELVLFITGHGFIIAQQDAPKHNKVNLLCLRPELI